MEPISVEFDMYTSFGFTMCSSGWPSRTACTSVGVTFPSIPSTDKILCPVASIAPVSCPRICPELTAMAASWGLKKAGDCY